MVFEEIYYRFRLLTFLMNHKKDLLACDILIACLNSGIKNVRDDNYRRLAIEFNNGVEAIFWDSNKYYAWLADGTFKRNNKVLYSYSSKMVSAKLMFKLEEALKEHVLKSLISI